MEFAEKYGLFDADVAREVDGVVNHGSTVEEAYRGLAAESLATKCTVGLLS